MQTIIMAATALLGGGGGIYSAFTVGETKRRLVADAEATMANTSIGLGKAAVEMMDPLRARVRELEEEVGVLRRQIRTLQEESEQAVSLRRQLATLTQEAESMRTQLAEKERVIAVLTTQRSAPPQRESGD